MASNSQYEKANGDFRAIDPTKARVILIEGADRVLFIYDRSLSKEARKQLEKLGVEVRTGQRVSEIEPGLVSLGRHPYIATHTTLWAAGL